MVTLKGIGFMRGIKNLPIDSAGGPTPSLEAILLILWSIVSLLWSPREIL